MDALQCNIFIRLRLFFAGKNRISEYSSSYFFIYNIFQCLYFQFLILPQDSRVYVHGTDLDLYGYKCIYIYMDKCIYFYAYKFRNYQLGNNPRYYLGSVFCPYSSYNNGFSSSMLVALMLDKIFRWVFGNCFFEYEPFLPPLSPFEKRSSST